MTEPLSRPRERRPDGEPADASSQAQASGERAVMNTLYRTGGEIVGRFASLLLFAVAGRSLGESGLGAFVFAVAFTGFVMVPVGLGLDRYLLREIAQERSSQHQLFFNVLALKLVMAVPLFALSFFGLHLIGYGAQAQETAWALAPGVFSDSVARTQLALFAAHERNGPPAVADAVNRVLSAVLGIVALKLGYGVVSVGVTYSIGSIAGVAIGFWLMARTIEIPSVAVARRRWRALAVRSVPFAVQEVFSTLLARVDTLILSALVTQAAVGRYGAAYRLFESTLFISYALVGAFSAMFTYLGTDTRPTLRTVFERSIKLSLVSLTPLAVVFVVLARPLCELIYGSAFGSAALPLRILGPGVVPIGMVLLVTSLVISRGDPRRIVTVTGVMVVVNVALNFILIPPYGVAGAAAAMLATEAVYLMATMRLALGTVQGIAWVRTAIGALAGGLAMTVASLPLHSNLPAGLASGLCAYLATLFVVERLVSPRDVRFVVRMARKRLRVGL
jgi:O-antigen/teichoic acid export membrane protein